MKEIDDDAPFATPRLASTHLLGAIDIIETIARARVQTAAYR